MYYLSFKFHCRTFHTCIIAKFWSRRRVGGGGGGEVRLSTTPVQGAKQLKVSIIFLNRYREFFRIEIFLLLYN